MSEIEPTQAAQAAAKIVRSDRREAIALAARRALEIIRAEPGLKEREVMQRAKCGDRALKLLRDNGLADIKMPKNADGSRNIRYFPRVATPPTPPKPKNPLDDLI